MNEIMATLFSITLRPKERFLSLSRVPPPSEHQMTSLSRLLDSVFIEHGLCPVKDLPTRQEIANEVGRIVSAMHPGK